MKRRWNHLPAACKGSAAGFGRSRQGCAVDFSLSVHYKFKKG
ncbi:hypothetical protein D3OALGA1CA_2467 [Olavius algarvensis associated proteobacterium Delta 3]|nr:hypothetical protein D3OALGA1CA_2467 [Olavius algarvensis associated proteobacterium Delta 3]CAB5154949.1 hypothetical protein D3OALGB2SA_5041 [Olavius algarvensis associated proteobacterium Delta 3]